MLQQTVDRPDIPERKGVIRMEMSKVQVAKQVGKDVHSTEFSTMNLKGMIPARLLNMAMSS